MNRERFSGCVAAVAEIQWQGKRMNSHFLLDSVKPIRQRGRAERGEVWEAKDLAQHLAAGPQLCDAESW